MKEIITDNCLTSCCTILRCLTMRCLMTCVYHVTLPLRHPFTPEWISEQLSGYPLRRHIMTGWLYMVSVQREIMWSLYAIISRSGGFLQPDQLDIWNSIWPLHWCHLSYHVRWPKVSFYIMDTMMMGVFVLKFPLLMNSNGKKFEMSSFPRKSGPSCWKQLKSKKGDTNSSYL